MANITIPLPLRGYSEGRNVSDSELDTTGSMKNIRPFDTFERRLRLGQRPGMKKVYDEQIGGSESPIVAICSISVVDYLGTA